MCSYSRETSQHATLGGIHEWYRFLSSHMLIHLCFSVRSSLISNEVSGFILEELLEFEALDEAVAEASLLGGQELVSLEREEAVLGALGHGRGSLIVLELLLHVLGEHLQVELSLHYFFNIYIIFIIISSRSNVYKPRSKDNTIIIIVLFALSVIRHIATASIVSRLIIRLLLLHLSPSR